MANTYQRFMPNIDPLVQTVYSLNDTQLPTNQLRRIGRRAESEARTIVAPRRQELQNIREQLRQTRAAALNQLETQREWMQERNQAQLQQLFSQVNRQANQQQNIQDSGFRIQQLIEAGQAANTETAQNLSDLAQEQAGVEQNFLQSLIENVLQPQFEIAAEQGRTATDLYTQYIQQAEQALFQGRLEEAEQLLNEAQRAYNQSIIAAENELLRDTQQMRQNLTSYRGFRKTYSTEPPAYFKRHLREAMRRANIPESWAEPLTELIYRESSWRPNADNPRSTAYGYGQFLDSTREAYERKTGLEYEGHPVNQIILTAQYIKDRYGNPWNALAFHDQNNWY